MEDHIQLEIICEKDKTTVTEKSKISSHLTGGRHAKEKEQIRLKEVIPVD